MQVKDPLTGKNPSEEQKPGKNAGKIEVLEKPAEVDDSMRISLRPELTSGMTYLP